MIWHNITKKIFNVFDMGDFIEELSQKDIVMYSEKGNGLLFPLLDLDCPYTLQEFKETYKECHGEPYLKLTKKDRDFLIKQVQKQGFLVNKKEKLISYYPATKEITTEAKKLRKEFDFLLQPCFFDY